MSNSSIKKVSRRFGGIYRLHLQGRRINRERNQGGSRCSAYHLLSRWFLVRFIFTNLNYNWLCNEKVLLIIKKYLHRGKNLQVLITSIIPFLAKLWPSYIHITWPKFIVHIVRLYLAYCSEPGDNSRNISGGSAEILTASVTINIIRLKQN
jgi:hypothetical protein